MYTYFLSLTPDTWSNTEDLLLPYISSERYIRLLRYVHAADRKLALYSELLTRMIILSHTSLTINNLQFYSKKTINPYFLQILPLILAIHIPKVQSYAAYPLIPQWNRY